MADKDSDEPIYPASGLPVLFADGIMNLSNNSEIVKFYLHRLDPSLNGVGDSSSSPVTQVVMPISSFAAMVVFYGTCAGGINRV